MYVYIPTFLQGDDRLICRLVKRYIPLIYINIDITDHVDDVGEDQNSVQPNPRYGS